MVELAIDLEKYEEMLGRGLSFGMGNAGRDGQVCLEAAVCYALDLPHGDEPTCVDENVRNLVIKLNDQDWSSPEARANGLRELGLAQLGTEGLIGAIDSTGFFTKVALYAQQAIIPQLLEDIRPYLNDGYNSDIYAAYDNNRPAATLPEVYEYLTLFTSQKCPPNSSCLWAAKSAISSCLALQTSLQRLPNRVYGVTHNLHVLVVQCTICWRIIKKHEPYAAPDKYLHKMVGAVIKVLREIGSPGCKLFAEDV